MFIVPEIIVRESCRQGLYLRSTCTDSERYGTICTYLGISIGRQAQVMDVGDQHRKIGGAGVRKILGFSQTRNPDGFSGSPIPNEKTNSPHMGIIIQRNSLPWLVNGGNILSGNLLTNLGVNPWSDMLTFETKWGRCIR